MILLRSIFFGYSVKKALWLVIVISLLKINTVFAQTVSFSVNSLSNLGLVYEQEADFETERVISNAIRLDIRARNQQLFVEAKTVATLNNAFTRLDNDVFSIQLVNASNRIGAAYFQRMDLDSNDRVILRYNSRGNRSYVFDYDLYFKPIGFEVEPGQYMYSILFTVTPN